MMVRMLAAVVESSSSSETEEEEQAKDSGFRCDAIYLLILPYPCQADDIFIMVEWHVLSHWHLPSLPPEQRCIRLLIVSHYTFSISWSLGLSRL